ncbi:MAG: 2-oxoglutarate dehydrogenase complex dihydrolipoyllysine-residue succinyltransferase, partial [Chloroflexi bacterium]|nr:2-oxoglutarate dehydrogenase complex dihydrolipoyllysine-residue succinyltransferase [Chloroflexota bacterium]
IAAGDVLAELETDKVTLEVNAPVGGTLEQILKQAGDTVAMGEIIGSIREAATEDQELPAMAPAQAASTDTVTPSTESQSGDGEHLRITPLARKLAETLGVNPRQVEPSGPGGRITRTDVAAFRQSPPEGTATLEAPGAQGASAPSAVKMQAYSAVAEREEVVPLSRRRRTIAQRLVEAKSMTAMLTTFNEVDMSAVVDLRKRRRDAFKERHMTSLGFMSFFTRAVVGALKAFPHLNSEIRGDNLIIKRHYDIGVAVDTEEGLVVPVVRDADRLTFAEIEQTISDLASKVRTGKLSIADLQGGTFTITNGGVFGSLFSTPLLNMPQAAILGMHRIQERPVVVDGQIVIRPMMYLALTYDHRIVDGREAVQFLARIRELIQDPELLLLEA